MKSEKGVAMKGSIRLAVGFFLVFGAVGGLDTNSATLTQGLILAAVGLGLMYSGVKAMERV
jgi:hypothetical protein